MKILYAGVGDGILQRIGESLALEENVNDSLLHLLVLVNDINGRVIVGNRISLVFGSVLGHGERTEDAFN